MSPTSPETQATSPVTEAERSSGRESTATLELLMDMEMPLVIRFGTTKMLLGELLQLGAGSVIEFPRKPDDPVDILVNGRVVARGVVVVVGGNYGVRISEVASGRDTVVNRVALAVPVEGNN